MSNNLKIYKQVAEKLGYDVEVVQLAYESSWEFIKNKIEELPLKSINTEEEFNTLRTNFNIPSLGKICCTSDRFKTLKNNYKIKQKLYERDKTDKDG